MHKSFVYFDNKSAIFGNYALKREGKYIFKGFLDEKDNVIGFSECESDIRLDGNKIKEKK